MNGPPNPSPYPRLALSRRGLLRASLLGAGAAAFGAAGAGCSVVGAGLARVEHRLWPLSSLKGTEGSRGRGRSKPKSKEHRSRRSSDHY